VSGFTLYSMPSSGNSYKVRLMLALLGRPYSHVAAEIASPELAALRAKGLLPTGTLPVLQIPGGQLLPESNAILIWLARGTAFWPEDPLQEARALGWMFFEQNRHEPVVAVRASLRCYPHRAADATPERLAGLLEAGHEVLAVMEAHLRAAQWFTGAEPGAADVALYAYTHSAGPRGGFEMERFGAVNDWCARIAALPGYVPLDALPA
jgi:glutathione S-transferase